MPQRTDRPKVVAIVGGGPAGMEAARRAAELGHRVTLLERQRYLGGQLRWAAATPPLKHFARLIEWYERQLEHLGVTIRLRLEGTSRSVHAIDADAVILATGATPDVPALDGYDMLATWSMDGLMSGLPSTTGTTGLPASVVIAGSGQRALATALWAAEAGAYVSLVSADRLGHDTSGLTRRAFITRLDRVGVRRTDGRISSVRQDGVVLADGSLVPANGLVLADPLRPEMPTGVEGTRIGDAREPRDVAAAIAEGRQAAEAI